MAVDANENLDVIFAEIGNFGAFQVITFVLICIPNIISAAYVVNYVFTANSLDYRCKVPECDVGDNNREISYDQPWLKYAIPKTEKGYDNCYRYAPNDSSIEVSCDVDNFNTSRRIKCAEYIYTTDEKNIQTEFDIHCDDSFLLSLIGTASSIGRLVFLLISGILSDKFGRLRVVLISMLCCSTFGLIKSFSVNYQMYIVLEFFEGSANSSIFSCFFVLAIELLSSKFRVLGIALIGITYPLGEILLGVLAMYIHDFRFMLRVLYAPGLFVIFYFWLVPESIRWLLVTGRVDHAIKVLQRIAKVNRRTLSEKSIEQLRKQYSMEIKMKASDEENTDDSMSIFQQSKLVLTSRKLGLRLLNCCYLWFTCCFYYYGMSLVSTHIPGTNRYIGFIIVQAVEIPGAILSVILLTKCGRKKLLFGSMVMSGLVVVVAPFIPIEQSIITLILFMIGKSANAFAFKVLYIFTAELWPTQIRATIMNSCSMVGKIGSVFATFNSYLITKNPFVPFLLFGSSAIVAGFLVLLYPETYAKKLPDTVEEVKNL